MTLLLVSSVFAQQAETPRSIGGKEHESHIYGVKIGMSVPQALEAVFVNANRKPGQEKPDAKRSEGKDKKDIRVVYNELPAGELQIVFAEGKWVKEAVLKYKSRPNVSDLRLPNSTEVWEAIDGERYEDRYSIGFVDNKKQEKIWWRDEKSADGGYSFRITFLSGNALKDATLWWQVISQKIISVKPGDEDKFAKAMKPGN